MPFPITPAVAVRRDKRNRVRQLEHAEQPFSADVADLAIRDTSRLKPLADAYLREVASLFDFSGTELAALNQFAEAAPVAQGRELRFHEEKREGGAGVVAYDQTQFGLPVYEAGVSVVIDATRRAVIGSNNQVDYAIDLPPPDPEAPFVPEKINEATLSKLLVLAPARIPVINEKRQLIYRYIADERFDPQAKVHENADDFTGFAGKESTPFPTLKLAPVHSSVRDGQAYVVTEVLFTLPDDVTASTLNWRCFIEIVTGSVLLLRPLVACASGSHFVGDPVTKSGLPLSAGSPAADLDAQRTSITLQWLNAPTAGIQKLEGTHVALQDIEDPTVTVPQKSPPYDFTFSVRSPDFASCCAYHNCQLVYEFIQSIGINLATYFDGTAFPVPVDPHALSGDVNAQARGNTTGNGMGAFVFGRASSGATVGIAADARVVWHEFGHALLWDHVNSPNFGFAHSAGDTLGALHFDADSRLRGTPDRFETFPFMRNSAGLSRRHDRAVSAGWAWGGVRDDTQYGSEQILSTTLFRIYQIVGGDDEHDLAERQWAARYLMAIIVKAIGLLSRTTRDPRVYVDALIQADQTHGMFEGHPGGAFRKIFRWSFEQQGLYQPAGAPLPITAAGDPPAVDVFIQNSRQPDGRYQPFLSDFRGEPWIVNRRAPDGGNVSEPPARGKTNFLYVTIGNRGSNAATGIQVRGFQQDTMNAPMSFPADWVPLSTALLPGPASVARGVKAVVGPFSWTPNRGTQEVLFAVDAVGDGSNISTITAGPILNRRLVRLDNNIAQVEFTTVAGA
jgi:hypothetical protein